MESTIVGIASVESKDINTAKGPGTLFIVKDDLGVEYTTFDRELAVQAAGLKGHNATIGFDTTTNVKPNKQGVDTTYTNRYLKTLSSANGATPEIVVERSIPLQSAPVVIQGVTLPLGATSSIQAQPSHSDRESSIARAVALKAAVDLASNGVLNDPTASGITSIAKFFEPYLLGKDTPTEQTASPVPLVAAGVVSSGADDIPFSPSIDGIS